jgi:hypothetical protein
MAKVKDGWVWDLFKEAHQIGDQMWFYVEWAKASIDIDLVRLQWPILMVSEDPKIMRSPLDIPGGNPSPL